jgi:type IV secretion system protein VirB10
VTGTPVSPGAAAPAKADPETLVLRAAPGRVTRFRRGAIVAIAAASSTAIAGAAWFALKPGALHLVASGEDRQVAAKAPPDALAGAPTSYGDVPQLGPPLPGDLGRPVLNHQRTLDIVTPTDPGADAAQRAAQAAEAERERIAAEQRAARESGVMLQLAGTATRTGAAAPAAPDASATAEQQSDRPALDPDRDPN